MDADWSVDLRADAPAMEMPWSDPDGTQRFYDLRARPELLLEVGEAHDNQPLGEFLNAINTPRGAMQTVKCDTWLSREITEEEKIYGAALKYASYIDLVFTSEQTRLHREKYEQFARALCTLLGKAPSISVAAEFVIRRCYIHQSALAAGKLPAPDAPASDSVDAFGMSFFLTGYGDEEDEAIKRWTIGLKLVENAILQLAAKGI